jgi:YggT family protein
MVTLVWLSNREGDSIVMVILTVVRGLVFATFVWCAFVALGSWAVRTRQINPFSWIGQTIRKLTDPTLKPVEQWLLKRGSNPQNAGWWVLGIGTIGGIIVVSLTNWVLVQAVRMASAGASGPRGVIRLVVASAGRLIIIALMVRVIGSWFGKGRFTKWMRPAYVLTDWIVGPLRKIVPPFGMFDISPLVAYFLLEWVVLPLLMNAI